MTISSVSSLNSLLSTTSTTSNATASSTDATAPADSTDLSDQAQLLERLKELEESDPTQFQQVTATIADKLKAEAQGATGPKAAFLTDLANKFTQAGQTGDLSALQPPAPSASGQGAKGSGHAHHHGGGHHHYAAQSQSSSSTDGPEQISSVISNALSEAGA